MNKQYIITIILIIIVGVGGFYGGMQYQKSQRGNFASGQFTNRNGGQGGFGGRGGNNRPVIGEIISQDDNSITVKMQDGSSRIVILSDKTTINKATVAVKSDLKVGEKVVVFGAINTDGSVTAQNVQLNPIGRLMNASPSAR